MLLSLPPDSLMDYKSHSSSGGEKSEERKKRRDGEESEIGSIVREEKVLERRDTGCGQR